MAKDPHHKVLLIHNIGHVEASSLSISFPANINIEKPGVERKLHQRTSPLFLHWEDSAGALSAGGV
jgi:hypothetical protein